MAFPFSARWSSTNSTGRGWSAIASSSERYRRKDFRGSSHRILASWVKRLPPQTSILELGPAAGHVAALSERRDLRWTGLESDVGHLGALHRQFSGGAVVDIESLPRLPAGHDVILAADVLEHLSDPGGMLHRIHDALPPSGLLFLSVPNVANLQVRLALLFGRFTYTERGILDRTHRVFFTRRTASRLLESSGFVIERRAVSTIPLPLALPRAPRFLLDLLLLALDGASRLLPTLLGYQLLFVARRR